MAVPVIDLFAGPGGLGEGFSSIRNIKGENVFKISLSIEKDDSAHKTLELRSFFRQFPDGEAPEEYYRFLRQDGISRDELFSRYKIEAQNAQKESWHYELAENNSEEIDIRINEALQNKRIWVLIGGPPCQAYSIAGRVRRRSKENPEEFEKDHRHFLYREYLRIIARHRPSIFVLENVKGILSSTIQGNRIFDQILTDLRNPLSVFPAHASAEETSYKIFSLVKEPTDTQDENFVSKDFVVKCEKYGIPQTRHRVILLGMRNDFITVIPSILKEGIYTTIEDVINYLPILRSGLSKEEDNAVIWEKRIFDALDKRWLKSLKKQQGQKFYKYLVSIIKNMSAPFQDRGNEFIQCDAPVAKELQWWFNDPKLGGVCNHATRSHMLKDIYRYIYAACFAQIYDRSPKLSEYPADLLPEHENAKSGDFNDRFRVQIYRHPATTVTSHISKDGHYYIHPDPHQGRSLTVREAARLQTFPDNYYFCGNRTQQYAQVGNAVPPLLARQVAEIVNDILIPTLSIKSNGSDFA